ncbi:agamous-like MADS-box protein AGL62 [Impatiens glandulifera]|uniref:agamous-like MADS-box protein AGL62 n=1 Tax=Impatiens glandulifera TaxID=253017 RepID=UPI001FB0BC72|nr:agamous-like MADS-box protein AGL62 [Impatiens glandulifera]
MTKIQKESNIQVSLPKRRTRVFKKCCELTTLRGVQMLVMVFSLGKKVFTFGHQTVDEIINRFLGTHDSSSSTGISSETQQLVEDKPLSNVTEMNNQIMHVQEQLEIEKQRGKVIIQTLQAGREQRWWEGSIENMSYQQLEMIKRSLENMKALVSQNIYEVSNIFASSSSFNGGEGSFNGNIPEVGTMGDQSTPDVMDGDDPIFCGPTPSPTGPHLSGSGGYY